MRRWYYAHTGRQQYHRRKPLQERGLHNLPEYQTNHCHSRSGSIDNGLGMLHPPISHRISGNRETEIRKAYETGGKICIVFRPVVVVSQSAGRERDE